MKLHVISSGSSGNCYILENNTEALIIEAGLPFLEVKKALDFNVRKIVGVVVGHIHSDHSKHIKEYQKAGISILAPYLHLDGDESNTSGTFGSFKIKAFPLVHDVPCYGFYITHPDIGNLVYATDTEYIKWRFSHINHVLVEADYSDDFIEMDAVNREHVLRGHMSLQTALDFIQANDNPGLRNVVLLHLSNRNADAEMFRQAAGKVTDKQVYIAEKGLEVDLNLCPF